MHDKESKPLVVNIDYHGHLKVNVFTATRKIHPRDTTERRPLSKPEFPDLTKFSSLPGIEY